MSEPLTIGGLIASGRGMTGVCRDCGREKAFSSAAVVALPLPRDLTLAQAGTKLTCRDCRGQQIILEPASLQSASLDPQAPLPAAGKATTGDARA